MAGSIRAGSYSSFSLSTFRAVEDNPDDQVIREVHEPVRDSSRNEQKIAGRERLLALAVDKLTAACDDDISLIARVRLLRVLASRSVNLHD